MKKYRIYTGLVILLLIFLVSCAAVHTHYMDTLILKQIKDGTYTGKDSAFLCSVEVVTTVKDNKITDVKIVRHRVSYPLAARAYTIIPKRIVEKQSLDVDAVTGATVSTDNIKKAIYDSLRK